MNLQLNLLSYFQIFTNKGIIPENYLYLIFVKLLCNFERHFLAQLSRMEYYETALFLRESLVSFISRLPWRLMVVETGYKTCKVLKKIIDGSQVSFNTVS